VTPSLPSDNPWTRDVFTCVNATRVLVFRHLADDTYVIIEGGEVSLSNSETLKQLIRQLSGGNR
jgi:hypothetical protein